MEKNELVSVIMPAYNAESFICEAINSVISQTYSNWELIIIDDGSTDTTANIVNECLLKDKRIQYYYQENGKQGKARNLGIKNAKGDYLAFLDADDIWMPEKLSYQIQEIEEKKVDLIFSDSYVFQGNDIRNRSRKMDVKNGFYYGKNSVIDFVKKNKIPILTVLVRKEKILSVNGFSEKEEIQNAEDYHLWLKMLMKDSTFYGTNKCLAGYRLHEKSTTNDDPLCKNQVIEVFYDLVNKDRRYKNIFNDGLKKELKLQLDKNQFSKRAFHKLVEKQCCYLKKFYLIPLIKFIYFFFGKKIAKQSLKLFLYS